jgi:hypothetical protein
MSNELPDVVKENAAKSAQLNQPQYDVLDEILKKSDDFFMPWENVELPSKGIYYSNMPKGIIKVRPMGIDVDKMMANQRIVQSGDLLNKIIEACVQLPDGMTVQDLLAGDQFFLLYYLRGITHGSDYEFVTDCPHCGVKSTYDYNLSDLSKTIKGPNPEYPVEPMSVELSFISGKIGKKVEALVRLVRVKDVSAMSKGNNTVIDPLRRGKARVRGQGAPKVSKQDADDLYTKNISMTIVGFRVDGIEFKDDRKSQLIDKLHQKDSATIREFIDSVTPGIDTSVEVTCQNEECKKDYSISLPFGENFFRPSKK